MVTTGSAPETSPGGARRSGLEQDWASEVRRIEHGLWEGLAPARVLPGVHDVRVLGAVGVVRLDRPVDIPTASRAALREGVWLRPFRDTVYTMPPYVIEDVDVARIGAAVCAAAMAG